MDFKFIAILAATIHRDYTGKGQYIDTSVHGACALTTEMHVVQWIYMKRVVRRQTARHAGVNPTARRQFPTKDGKLFDAGRPLLVSSGVRVDGQILCWPPWGIW